MREKDRRKMYFTLRKSCSVKEKKEELNVAEGRSEEKK